jgi:hypothetical protein
MLEYMFEECLSYRSYRNILWRCYEIVSPYALEKVFSSVSDAQWATCMPVDFGVAKNVDYAPYQPRMFLIHIACLVDTGYFSIAIATSTILS